MTQGAPEGPEASAPLCRSPDCPPSPRRRSGLGASSPPLQHHRARNKRHSGSQDDAAQVSTSAWLEAGFDQALTGEQGLLQSVTSLAGGDVPSPCAPVVVRVKAAEPSAPSRLRESMVASCWQDRFMNASCTSFGVLESANFSELDAEAEAEFLRELDAEVARSEGCDAASNSKSRAAHCQPSVLLRSDTEFNVTFAKELCAGQAGLEDEEDIHDWLRIPLPASPAPVGDHGGYTLQQQFTSRFKREADAAASDCAPRPVRAANLTHSLTGLESTQLGFDAIPNDDNPQAAMGCKTPTGDAVEPDVHGDVADVSEHIPSQPANDGSPGRGGQQCVAFELSSCVSSPGTDNTSSALPSSPDDPAPRTMASDGASVCESGISAAGNSDIPCRKSLTAVVDMQPQQFSCESESDPLSVDGCHSHDSSPQADNYEHNAASAPSEVKTGAHELQEAPIEADIGGGDAGETPCVGSMRTELAVIKEGDQSSSGAASPEGRSTDTSSAPSQHLDTSAWLGLRNNMFFGADEDDVRGSVQVRTIDVALTACSEKQRAGLCVEESQPNSVSAAAQLACQPIEEEDEAVIHSEDTEESQCHQDGALGDSIECPSLTLPGCEEEGTSNAADKASRLVEMSPVALTSDAACDSDYFYSPSTGSPGSCRTGDVIKGDSARCASRQSLEAACAEACELNQESISTPSTDTQREVDPASRAPPSLQGSRLPSRNSGCAAAAPSLAWSLSGSSVWDLSTSMVLTGVSMALPRPPSPCALDLEASGVDAQVHSPNQPHIEPLESSVQQLEGSSPAVSVSGGREAPASPQTDGVPTSLLDLSMGRGGESGDGARLGKSPSAQALSSTALQAADPPPPSGDPPTSADVFVSDENRLPVQLATGSPASQRPHSKSHVGACDAFTCTRDQPKGASSWPALPDKPKGEETEQQGEHCVGSSWSAHSWLPKPVTVTAPLAVEGGSERARTKEPSRSSNDLPLNLLASRASSSGSAKLGSNLPSPVCALQRSSSSSRSNGDVCPPPRSVADWFNNPNACSDDVPLKSHRVRSGSERSWRAGSGSADGGSSSVHCASCTGPVESNDEVGGQPLKSQSECSSLAAADPQPKSTTTNTTSGDGRKGDRGAVQRRQSAGQQGVPSRSASQSGANSFHLIGNDPIAVESGKRLRDVLTKGVSRLRKPGSFVQVKAGDEKSVAASARHPSASPAKGSKLSASFREGVLTGAAPAQVRESGSRRQSERAMRPPPGSAAKGKSNVAAQQVNNFLGACTPRSRPLTESLAMESMHSVRGTPETRIPTPARGATPSKGNNVAGILKFLSTPVSSMKKSRSALTGSKTPQHNSTPDDDERP